MPRNPTAYNKFIGSRLKGLPSHQLPDAMRAAAREWTGRRSNPSGNGLVKVGLLAGAAYIGYQIYKGQKAQTGS